MCLSPVLESMIKSSNFITRIGFKRSKGRKVRINKYISGLIGKSLIPVNTPQYQIVACLPTISIPLFQYLKTKAPVLVLYRGGRLSADRRFVALCCRCAAPLCPECSWLIILEIAVFIVEMFWMLVFNSCSLSNWLITYLYTYFIPHVVPHLSAFKNCSIDVLCVCPVYWPF